MPTLRLLTYNVRSMRDDREALGRVIRSAAAEVVLIQESPRFLRWRSLCAQLARTSNLVVVSGGRAAGSNLILSSLAVDVDSSTDVLFSREPKLHRRGTAIAVLRYRGARFAVAGIHLDLVEAPRLRHIGELDAAIDAHVPADVRTVVAGDVNDQPGSLTWAALTARRRDAFAEAGVGEPNTSSAQEPRRRIDAVFTDPGIEVRTARVLVHPELEAASDHRPVLAELDL
ncbi:MAG: endonuclease/exonuclease/phosphatase family protein [Actinomycetota bacterium]|nr:endonuclease/exonuclease/phosphatase family protein [Actinomycetota bacterium]